MRVSIYLGEDRKWLIELLNIRVKGGKLTGRKTSIGRELLHAAEQHFLQGIIETQRNERTEIVDT
jgi:hypothetical protein